VYVRLVATCPTCGMRVNGKRFSEDYRDLAPKAMFTVIRKGVKGLNTEVRDIASDPESQKVVASIEESLALSILDTLFGYWEVMPWLREETLRKLRAVVSPSELRILSPSLTVSPSGRLRIPIESPSVMVSPSGRLRIPIESRSVVMVGTRTKMGTGALVRLASTSKSLGMGSRSSLALSRTAPMKSSMPLPKALGSRLTIISNPGIVRVESDSEVYSK